MSFLRVIFASAIFLGGALIVNGFINAKLQVHSMEVAVLETQRQPVPLDPGSITVLAQIILTSCDARKSNLVERIEPVAVLEFTSFGIYESAVALPFTEIVFYDEFITFSFIVYYNDATIITREVTQRVPRSGQQEMLTIETEFRVGLNANQTTFINQLSVSFSVVCREPFIGPFCETCSLRPLDCCGEFHSSTPIPANSDNCTQVFSPPCTDRYVRVVNGTTVVEEGMLMVDRRVVEGRVEVCLDGLWVPVCDSILDTQEISVFCRQLGYQFVVNLQYDNGQCPLPPSSVYLDDIRCMGEEDRLLECDFSRTESCTATAAASAICASGRVRPRDPDIASLCNRVPNSQVSINRNRNTVSCDCLEGFTPVMSGAIVLECQDVNECNQSARIYPCDVNAICENVPGSYNCSCRPGFQGNGTSCTDIDECTRNGTCDTNALCINSPGSFVCNCKRGFVGNGQQCVDIDECLQFPLLGLGDACVFSGVQNSECVNLEGRFDCVCNSGFRPETVKPSNETQFNFTCKNIIECVEQTSPCDVNAECVDTVGSFNCTCNVGYTGDGIFCSNINECLEAELNETNICEDNGVSNADCFDEDGWFRCDCRDGYEPEPSPLQNGTFDYTCVDIDECTQVPFPCHLNATCQNRNGSFSCTCNPGYSGDGRACIDIDECLAPDACVSANVSNAACVNQNGAFDCECNVGFHPEFTPDAGPVFPYKCVDTDECDDSPCDGNASCFNLFGSYSCMCRSGFTGDGQFCIGIDCPVLESPPNGEYAVFRSAVWAHSALAQLFCRDGFVAQGQAVFGVCAVSQWMEFLPTCVPESASVIAAPEPTIRIVVMLEEQARTPEVTTVQVLAAVSNDLRRATIRLLNAGVRRSQADDIQVILFNCSGVLVPTWRTACSLVVVVDEIFLSTNQLTAVVQGHNDATAQTGVTTITVLEDDTSDGSSSSSDSSGQLSAGAIVGIVIAVVVAEWILFVLVIALCIRFGKDRLALRL